MTSLRKTAALRANGGCRIPSRFVSGFLGSRFAVIVTPVQRSSVAGRLKLRSFALACKRFLNNEVFVVIRVSLLVLVAMDTFGVESC